MKNTVRKYCLLAAKSKIFKMYTFGSLVYAPMFIVILLICKHYYFNVSDQFDDVSRLYTQEHAHAASIALNLALYQNHKEILDLQKKFNLESRSLSSDDLILEKDIEFL